MACPNHPDVDEGLVRCLRCQEAFCADCLVVLSGDPFCARCKDERVRDVLSGTTERFELAPIGPRLAAFVLDGFLKLITVYAIMIPVVLLMFGGMASVGALGEGGKQPTDTQAMAMGFGIMGLYFAFAFAVPLGVDLLYEALMLRRWGQTLGKMALGLKVVSADGGELSRGQVWGRTAVKAGLGSVCLLVDDVCAFFTQEQMAIHDLAARTRVVRARG
jgi:uncharacterized RDD family membrane protein YckC